jgi:hypothetical protein
MALTEYGKGEAFPGVIGRTVDEFEPAWRGYDRERRTFMQSYGSAVV